jgi:hypothetical protein
VGALKLYKRENNTSVKGALGLYVGFKKGCAGAYRYGFNGQEKVDEISGVGNHNTALFWEYDTRLGRRWNLDPVVKPWESGYASLLNNPIHVIDPFGDDGYVDENGNHLGDDGNKESHQTRVMNSDSWKKSIGDKKEITDEMRANLVKGSTLLSKYTNGISISDATWDKLTDAGGSKITPWLSNNSDFTVYAKSEDGADVFTVGAKKDLYYTSDEKVSGIDGFAAPHLQANEVCKVVSGTRVTISNTDYSTSTGTFKGFFGNATDGGWKSDQWLKMQSANKITTQVSNLFGQRITSVKTQNDKQWISIFQYSGLLNASQYYKYYELKVEGTLMK